VQEVLQVEEVDVSTEAAEQIEELGYLPLPSKAAALFQVISQR